MDAPRERILSQGRPGAVVALFGDGLGDHLLALPALRALAAGFAGRLIVPCRAGLEDVLFGDLPLGGVFRFPGWDDVPPGAPLPAAVVAADTVLVLSPWTPESLCDLTFTTCRAVRSFGYDPRCHSESTPDFRRHASDLAFDVVRVLLPAARIGDHAGPLSLPEPAVAAASRLASFRQGRRLLVLHGDTSPTKRLPAADWLAILDRVLGRRDDLAVAIVGLAGAGLEVAAERWPDRVRLWLELPFATTCAVIAAADAFAGVDSSLLHVADLAGVPGLGVFRASDPREYGFRFAPRRHVLAAQAPAAEGPALDADRAAALWLDLLEPHAARGNGEGALLEEIASSALASPVPAAARGALSVFSALCARHVPYYLYAIKTFLAFTRLPCQVFVLDDGTLDEEDRALLEEEVPGITVVLRAFADECAERLRGHPACVRLVRENLLGTRLFAPLWLGASERFVILDSDVLCFRRPERILRWAGGEERGFLYNRDSCTGSLVLDDDDLRGIGVTPVEAFNAGLVLGLRDRIEPAFLETVLERIHRTCCPDTQWVWEQTAWAATAARGEVAALPAEYTFVNDYNPGAPAAHLVPGLVTRHYSGSRRRDFFLEGVRYLLDTGALNGCLPAAAAAVRDRHAPPSS